MRAHPAFVGLALIAVVAACGDDGGNDHPDAATDATTARAVSLLFTGEVNGLAFACGQAYSNVGTTAAPFTPADFRFYVHDVRLVGTADVAVTLDENDYQNEGVALVDLETGGAGCNQGTTATHPAITGMVPDGTYTGIKFKLGLPFDRNHLDANTAVAPLNDTTMWWTWRSGFKFLKVDAASGTSAFLIHLGSTGCPGPSGTQAPSGPCTAPNVVEVSFSAFDTETQTIVADLGHLLANSDLTVNGGGPPGCMSDETDPECVAVFNNLGLPLAGAPARPQTFFSVR